MPSRRGRKASQIGAFFPSPSRFTPSRPLRVSFNAASTKNSESESLCASSSQNLISLQETPCRSSKSLLLLQLRRQVVQLSSAALLQILWPAAGRMRFWAPSCSPTNCFPSEKEALFR